MYSTESNIVFGFHGCEISLADKLINNPDEMLHYSSNLYDWLGKGMYFWENDPNRALVFWEGNQIYKNAGFRDRNHIQISVINPNCIKGFFLPRKIQKFNFEEFMPSDSKLLEGKK